MMPILPLEYYFIITLELTRINLEICSRHASEKVNLNGTQELIELYICIESSVKLVILLTVTESWTEKNAKRIEIALNWGKKESFNFKSIFISLKYES